MKLSMALVFVYMLMFIMRKKSIIMGITWEEASKDTSPYLKAQRIDH
jgi:hypothetical protein